MKLLHRIWQDFRRGENIDLYLTAMVSIVLVVLNIVSIVPPSWTAPLNLSVLALLSIAILGNRYRIETILEKITARNELLLTEFPEDLARDIDRSKELTILGVGLSRILHLHYSRFLEKLQRGDTIRILLVNPDGPGCDIAAMREYPPITPDDQRAAIRRSLGIFHELRQKTAGKLEIRLADHPLTFGAIVGDPETSQGVLYLWHYGFKTRVANRPKMVLRPADGYWYEHFKEEVTSIWDSAAPWHAPGERDGS
jgi:hypothetical protein